MKHCSRCDWASVAGARCHFCGGIQIKSRAAEGATLEARGPSSETVKFSADTSRRAAAELPARIFRHLQPGSPIFTEIGKNKGFYPVRQSPTSSRMTVNESVVKSSGYS